MSEKRQTLRAQKKAMRAQKRAETAVEPEGDGKRRFRPTDTHSRREHVARADASHVFSIEDKKRTRRQKNSHKSSSSSSSSEDNVLSRLSAAAVYADEAVLEDDDDDDDVDLVVPVPDTVPMGTAAKAIDGAAQFRTLELRELRRFESLTAFGQNLSEIALENDQWSPQRHPNRAMDNNNPAPELPISASCKSTLARAVNGYEIETPGGRLRPSSSHAITLEETQHEVYLYRDNFIRFNEVEQVLTIESEHYHWLGIMNLPLPPNASKKTKRKQEPIAITISQQDYYGLGRFIGIVRTVRSDHAFSIEASLLGRHAANPKPKTLLQAMRKINPMVKDAKLWFVDNARVCEKLLVFEDIMKYWNYKIGVVACRSGQTEEEAMLSNQETSPALAHFLTLLGDRIELRGWQGYTADLDTKMDASGKESVFTHWHDFSIMFHVSTLLPFDAKEPQQVGRKRFIGNDLVTIIFQDEETPFTPPTIVSNMIHVLLVISPLVLAGKLCYKVAVVYKQGVPSFGPPVGDSLVFEHGPYFREWLLTKLVNAERASLHHPWLSAFIKKTRRGQLEDILKDFVDQKKPKSQKLSTADSGTIAASAQAVARLKKHNRSQTQTAQAIERASTAPGRGLTVSAAAVLKASRSAKSSGAVQDAIDAQCSFSTGGTHYERLDTSVEWICDQCQKRTALFKVMVATGARLTLCEVCTRQKAEPDPSAVIDPQTAQALGMLDATVSAGGRPRRASEQTERPDNPAPVPPPALGLASGTTPGQRALMAKLAPPGSPRRGGRVQSLSLDSQALDGILSAMVREKDLQTPVRSSGQSRRSSGPNRTRAGTGRRRRTSRGLATTEDSSNGDDSVSNDVDKATAGDAFQSRLLELDRRIQELSKTANVDEGSYSSSEEENRTSHRKTSARGEAPPPLPPDEMVPDSIRSQKKGSKRT